MTFFPRGHNQLIGHVLCIPVIGESCFSQAITSTSKEKLISTMILVVRLLLFSLSAPYCTMLWANSDAGSYSPLGFYLGLCSEDLECVANVSCEACFGLSLADSNHLTQHEAGALDVGLCWQGGLQEKNAISDLPMHSLLLYP